MNLLEERMAKYDQPQKMKDLGIYPYFREIEGKQGTEVDMQGHRVLMFGSNAYTGLTGDDRVINAGIEAMKKYGAVYFAAIGGAGALLSKCIKSAAIIAYEDLGAEAIRRLEVENLPVIVVIDSLGNNLYETGRREYLNSKTK